MNSKSNKRLGNHIIIKMPESLKQQLLKLERDTTFWMEHLTKEKVDAIINECRNNAALKN